MSQTALPVHPITFSTDPDTGQEHAAAAAAWRARRLRRMRKRRPKWRKAKSKTCWRPSRFNGRQLTDGQARE